TLKMPAFEWVHVQLHQQKGMISLSPPTICNSAPAPGKVGGFPHGTGARQGGRISTQHRRPARWADSHTAPAPGKVGGFP
ncbi:hypothetical protein ACRWFR_28610, partial [Escherichia coli]